MFENSPLQNGKKNGIARCVRWGLRDLQSPIAPRSSGVFPKSELLKSIADQWNGWTVDNTNGVF